MSKATTLFAPRSTSISTRRWPTKPLEPVTTQWAGTSGKGALSSSSGDAEILMEATISGYPSEYFDESLTHGVLKDARSRVIPSLGSNFTISWIQKSISF
jgi:hypothetical protein